MPQYDYQCNCGREFTGFARVAERNAQSCPACGSKCECNAFSGSLSSAAAKPSAAWGPKNGRSLSFAFDPKQPEKWKKDMPSAEVDSTGAMVFRSDSHQRRVFKEMQAAKHRIEHEEAVKRTQERGDNGLPRHMAPGGVAQIAAQLHGAQT